MLYKFFFQEFELEKCKEISDIAKVTRNVSSLAHKQPQFLSGLAGWELWAPGK